MNKLIVVIDTISTVSSLLKSLVIHYAGKTQPTFIAQQLAQSKTIEADCILLKT